MNDGVFIGNIPSFRPNSTPYSIERPLRVFFIGSSLTVRKHLPILGFNDFLGLISAISGLRHCFMSFLTHL